MVEVAEKKWFKFPGLQEQYNKQFIILWLIGALTYMGFGFISPQFSLLVMGQGFTLQQFGFIQGLATLLSISSQVGIGKLSDRKDRRKPILIGALLLLIPVAILFPHAQSLHLFILLLAVNQLASSLFNATAANWVTRFGLTEQLGRLHGYYRISFTVGWILATWLMGKSLDRFGVAGTFYLSTIPLALALLLTIVLAKDVTSDETEISYASTPSGGEFVWPSELTIILAALGIFTLAQTMGMHLNYIFLKDEMQATNQQFGMLTSIQSWPEIPLMLILGIASDQVSNTALVTGGMILAGLRWLGTFFSQGVKLLYFIQPLHSIAVTITEVVVIAVITRQVPRRHLGTVMGWQVTITSVARLLAPILAGIIANYLGIRTVFLISSLISALAGLLLLYPYLRKKEK